MADRRLPDRSVDLTTPSRRVGGSLGTQRFGQQRLAPQLAIEPRSTTLASFGIPSIDLDGAATATATLSADLTTGIPLAAALTASTTVVPALTTAIRMAAGPLTGTATVAAVNLQTQIRLVPSGALIGSAVIPAAQLVTAIRLNAGPLTSTVILSAPVLVTGIRLAAVLAGTATVAVPGFAGATIALNAGPLIGSATLSTPVLALYRPLVAALTASGALATPTLTTGIPLGGALSGPSATISATLTTGIPLAAILSATAMLGAVAVPTLYTRIELRAALTAAAMLAAILSTFPVAKLPRRAQLVEAEECAATRLVQFDIPSPTYAQFADGSYAALAAFMPDEDTVIMSKKFHLNSGDVGRVLTMRLMDGDGGVFDVSGKVVRFRMESDDAASVLKCDRAAVIVDGLTGLVRHNWIAADLNAPGPYRARWVVDPGLPTEQSFPAAPPPDDFVRIVVNPAVG